ncbi:sortase [Bifidobacterium catenulatum]|uniref:sortase n=1 Tax=Bifidobacterium catenulatum TaxID=1686 RepID=UPI003F923838
MGAVRYPRLHISLPVRHGTDAATLEKSAGHLYGTSLPLGGGGGESTHAVVAAHRGLADRLMFTMPIRSSALSQWKYSIRLSMGVPRPVTNSMGEPTPFFLRMASHSSSAPHITSSKTTILSPLSVLGGHSQKPLPRSVTSSPRGQSAFLESGIRCNW